MDFRALRKCDGTFGSEEISDASFSFSFFLSFLTSFNVKHKVWHSLILFTVSPKSVTCRSKTIFAWLTFHDVRGLVTNTLLSGVHLSTNKYKPKYTSAHKPTALNIRKCAFKVLLHWRICCFSFMATTNWNLLMLRHKLCQKLLLCGTIRLSWNKPFMARSWCSDASATHIHQWSHGDMSTRPRL